MAQEGNSCLRCLESCLSREAVQATGVDVELIRDRSNAAPFVPRPPSPLCKTPGVDLSRPRGYRLIQSRDWVVLQDS
ncbi:hypothetical protein NQZ68_027873 [Dissostichus eleginoides]|nr:hypothetical protein NQZ68_027873 [Dissostichus eleginoides]